MLLIIGGEECLAVAGTAAVVDPQHDVAVVDEVLNLRAVTLARLATRTAMDPDERRRLWPGGGLVRFVENLRNGQAIE